jgi:hypothetical protein
MSNIKEDHYGNKTIDITDILSYDDFDSVIDNLITIRDDLRSKGFNHCTVDSGLEPVPYEDREDISIVINVR